MKRVKYRTTSDQVSETLPDETLTMQELVDRFVKGHSIPGLKNYPYDTDQPEEEPLPDIGMMSKTEVAQFKINVEQDIKTNEASLVTIRTNIAAKKQQLKKAEKQKQKQKQATEVAIPPEE